jgi:hypothetical protein
MGPHLNANFHSGYEIIVLVEDGNLNIRGTYIFRELFESLVYSILNTNQKIYFYVSNEVGVIGR